MELYVSGVPSSWSDDDLRSFVQSKVPNIELYRVSVRRSLHLRTFAFIGVNSLEDAEVLIHYLHDVKVESSKLVVQLCKTLSDGTELRTEENAIATTSKLFSHKNQRYRIVDRNSSSTSSSTRSQDNGWDGFPSRSRYIDDCEPETSSKSTKLETIPEISTAYYPSPSLSPPNSNLNSPLLFNDTIQSKTQPLYTLPQKPFNRTKRRSKPRPAFAQFPLPTGFDQAALDRWISKSWDGRLTSSTQVHPTQYPRDYRRQ